MKILVTGGRGQLATAIEKVASVLGIDCVALSKSTLDVCDPKEVIEALTHHSPDLVIQSAAYTQVDQSETEAALAYQVNALGAYHVAEACQLVGAKLLHISTDYVFGAGERPRAWREDDRPAPLNTYGWSKRIGEIYVHESSASSCVVRVAGLFSHRRESFVGKILSRIAAQAPLAVVKDQITTPTNCEQLALSLLQIGEYWCQGNSIPALLHIAGGPPVSWFEFARHIVTNHPEPALRTWPIRPVSSAELALVASRPSYSVLDDTLARSVCRVTFPDWRVGLSETVAAAWRTVYSDSPRQ